MTTTIRGACGHDCPDTCSWLVTVSDGKARTLVGDPSHPFTRGGLCAKVNDYLERVYHKDRVLYPLRRKGPKGAAEFERVSWDEALDDIAARWNQIVASDGAEAILPYSSAGTQGLIQMASLGERLFGSMGTTRLIRDICGEVAVAGLSAANGTGMGIDPEDIVHSRFIVLCGTNTIVTNLHLWPVILEARRRGAKVIVIDPVRTRTAAAADWHIAPKPATDGAVALAIMHVILREGLVDRDYVERYANGFETLVDRAREYSPERAAGMTGIEAAEIEKFAREYATTQPSLIRPLIGLEHHRNGATLFRTIACLPVLTGAWRHRGGGLQRSTGALQYSTLDVGGVRMPELNKPGVRTMNIRELGRYLCSTTLAPPLRSLMVYNCNPLVTNPNQNLVRRGFAREDLFTVVHELFVTETARYADYVLPAASQVECLDIVPAWGHHYLSMNQPAIAPLGESVSNTELFRMLARALGRTEPWLFESDESMLRAALASGHPWLD
ncbi:MAG: molybdopterin oxidoreductase family protein, partial [Acidobacteria bacterium]|nr:molybdopterin oxidoreductase family protein [Acidobacteriota bacterium]